MRALKLLGRFLDMGSWAVDLALSVGIFPYVLKLLQTTASDLRPTLVFIWTKILALDKTCQVDLVKDGGQMYFIQQLESRAPDTSAECRAQAAFVLAVICDGHPRGQLLCASASLLPVLMTQLQGARAAAQAAGPQRPAASLLLKWLCLCLGKLCEDMAEVTAQAIRSNTAELLSGLLDSPEPEVRAAAVFALGALVATSRALLQPGSLPEGHHHLQPLPAAERLHADAHITQRLLAAVGDASPLVRTEVAVALGRVASGHADMFQDAVLSSMRASDSGSPRSFPESGTDAAWDKLDRCQSTPLEQKLQARTAPAQRSVDSQPPAQENAAQPSASGTAAAGSHAEVNGGSQRAGTAAGAVLGNPAAIPAGGAVPAVGWDMYRELLEAVCLLVTDPQPQVATAAAAVLRAADVELTVMPVPVSSASSMALPPMQTAASVPLSAMGAAGLVPSGSAGSLQKAVAKLSNWRSASTAGAARSAGANSQSSSPPSPSSVAAAFSATTTLALRRLHEVPHRYGSSQYSFEEQAAGDGAPGAHAQQRASAFSGGGAPAGSSPPGPRSRSLSMSSLAAPLPASLIYKTSCDYFSWPLLEPQASAFRVEHLDWKGQPDPAKQTERMIERDESIGRCKAVSGVPSGLRSNSSGKSPPNVLSQQALKIETESPTSAAFCFHPFKPLLTMVDLRGVVRVVNYRMQATDTKHTLDARAITNRFHIAKGDSAHGNRAEVRVVSLHHLNEIQGGMLLSGAADGSVRVWRHFSHRGAQRLATAWRAVPWTTSVGSGSKHNTVAPAVFEWEAARGRLLAAGGSTPAVVHAWDLHQEKKSAQVWDSEGGAAFQHLACPRDTGPPLLFAGASDGTVKLFDLRGPGGRAAASIKVHDGPLVGIALGPGDLDSQLVSAAVSGEIKYTDFRVTSSQPRAASEDAASSRSKSSDSAQPCTSAGARMGVWKTVKPDEKGPLAALAAHPYAPLLSTASYTAQSQVVRVWGSKGDSLACRRSAAGSLPAQRQISANSLSWHPYQLLFAASGADSVVSIFEVDMAASSSPVSSLP